MHTALPYIIDQFARLHILVLGEAMLDSYLVGAATRLSQEAPVPVVSITSREDLPGGAANVAANVSALGANVALLSVVGDDAEANMLSKALISRGMSEDNLLTATSRRTLAKHRVMAREHMLVRFDQGSIEQIDKVTEQALIDRLHRLWPQCDATIVSDYGYGILTPRVIKSLARLQACAPRILAVDARELQAYRSVGITAVKPNYAEVAQLLELHGEGARAAMVAAQAERVLELTGAQIAAVTLDAEGALVFERGNPAYRTYARPVSGSRTIGSGDTYMSTLALSLAAGADTPAAAELAAAAAQIVVSREGTSVCTAALLREYVTAGDKVITNYEQVAARISLLRQQGRHIVFTNGCFDILHRGHVTYLSRAKALGDVLIIGVNSDASVRSLKGPLRPVNALEDRMQVLAALSCVDLIVPFNENTPCALIEIVRPDVFVKGGDYTRERLPEAPLVEQYGGIIQILPYLDNHSTTTIIERIHHAYIPISERTTLGNERGY